MVERLFKLVLVVIVITGVLIHAGVPDKNSVDRVITKEELELYGIVRLTDVLTLVDEWQVSSIDGYRVYSDAGSGNTYNNQDWLVLMDGVAIDLKYVEFQHINMLPLSIKDIERVEVVTKPGVYNGNFVRRGAINFVTRGSIKDFSFDGLVSTGNPTGDPGPYRYTELDSKNIDQLGPDYSFRVAGKYGVLESSFSSKYQIHTSTAPIMEIRNDDLPWIYRQTRQMSYFGRVALELDNHDIELFGGRSQTGNPGIFNEQGADLMFMNLFGKEIHAMNDVLLSALKWNCNLSNKVSIGIKGGFSNKKLYPFPETSIKADLSEDNAFTNVSFNYSKPEFSFAINYNYRHSERSMKWLNFGEVVDFHSTNFFIYKEWFDFLNTRISFSLLKGSRDLAKSYSVNFNFPLGEKNEISFDVASTEMLFEERTDWWNITKSNSIRIIDNSINAVENERQANDRIFTMDLSWKNRNENYLLDVNLFYKSYSDYQVGLYNYEMNDGDKYPASSLIRNYYLGSNQVGLKSKFLVGWTFDIKTELFYKFQTSTDKFNLLWNELVSFPNHYLSLRFNYSVVSSFSFWVKCKWQSETDWKNLILLHTETLYSTYVPSHANLDIGIKKSFWKNRIVLNLQGENIFGGGFRTHPLGMEILPSIKLVIGINI